MAFNKRNLFCKFLRIEATLKVYGNLKVEGVYLNLSFTINFSDSDWPKLIVRSVRPQGETISLKPLMSKIERVDEKYEKSLNYEKLLHGT